MPFNVGALTSAAAAEPNAFSWLEARSRRRALARWLRRWRAGASRRRWLRGALCAAVQSRRRGLVHNVLRTWGLLAAVLRSRRVALQRHAHRSQHRAMAAHLRCWWQHTQEARCVVW
jgi:hypothetical protein